MRRTLALTLPLLLLAACASEPDQPNAQPQAKQECDRTYSTGSMLPKKDCAPTMTDEERQRMQDELERATASHGSAPPGASGK